MIFRTSALVAATVLLAACASHPSSPASHLASSPAAPVSCRQQYQTWRHGPAQVPASRLAAALRIVQPAGKSGDASAIRSAMRELIPAAVALAARPMPHCADPAGLYAKLIDRIYAAGHNARSAKGLTSLRRAAAPLRSVKAIERQLTAELHRAAETGLPSLLRGRSTGPAKSLDSRRTR